MNVRRRILLPAAAAVLALAGCSAAPAVAPSTAPHPPASAFTSVPAVGIHPSAAMPTPAPVSATWPSYHANNARTGAVSSSLAIRGTAKRLWSRDLGGAVYGQPVVANGTVIAATETNRVVALNPHTGKVIWSRSIGAPLRDVQGVAGCGNIGPLGITGAPAVDARRGEVFVVGEVVVGGTVHHRLVGLGVRTGKVLLSEYVDPPLPAGEKTANLLQRPGLAVSKGRVYIAFGGNAGDCGHYHGWLVGVNETGAPHRVSFMVARGGEGGAIWQSGGAPAVDAQGDVYVATGNSNPWPGGTDPGRYAESLVKLSPSLKVIHAFKDPIAGGDADLSTANPVLLPTGSVYTVGKTDHAYFLSASSFALRRNIGGVCGSDPDGGSAYQASTHYVFTPCRGGGIQVIDLAHHRLLRKLDGPNSAPILVGNQLWALAYNSGQLFEFNAKTGRLVQQLNVGRVPNFATPSAGGGRLYIGTMNGVTAVG